ncbi:MAG: sugar transferase [Novosphingobium sp.]|nr:sugar transferase [Novosphingobium sp.]
MASRLDLQHPPQPDAAPGAGEAGGCEPRAGRSFPPLAPSLERRRLQIYILLLLADAAVILTAFNLVGYLYFGEWLERTVMLEAQLVLPVYWTIAIANNAYSAGAALDPRTGAWRATVAIVLAVVAVVLLAFYLKAADNFSRVVSGFGTLAAALGLAVARDLLSGLARWRCGPTATNTLVINDGGRELAIPHALAIDARACGLSPDIADPHALHLIARYLRNMDRVVVTCAPERRQAWALVLKGAAVLGEIVDDDIHELGAVGAFRTPDYASLVIARGPLRLTNRMLKRGLDLAIAAPALVLLAPLFVIVALAIKLEDGGPVFFVQRRLGRSNDFFDIYKFRSMRVTANDREGAVSASPGDARATRVGRFIRATSIDELPQLANVLLGEMSVVGPRPHALGSQAGEKLFWQVDRRYWQRHALKPGMTGLAQVRGLRGATVHEDDLVDRLQADLEYLDGWTIWRDLAILLATLRVVIHRKAY